MLSTTIKRKNTITTVASIFCLLMLMTVINPAIGKGWNTPQAVVIQGSDSIRVRVNFGDEGYYYLYEDHEVDDHYDYDFDFNFDDFNFDFNHDFNLDYNGEMLLVLPDLEDMEFLLETQQGALQVQVQDLRDQEGSIRESTRESMRESVRASTRASVGYRVQYEEDREQVMQAYQDAYNLVLQGKWKRALDAFNEYLTKYPRTRYKDDARFWICYSLEHSGTDDEEVFHFYNAFVTDFPRSSWEDDAKDSLVKIGRRLVAINRKNKAKFGPIVDAIIKDANAEVALIALLRLQRSGGEHVTEIILKTYDPEAEEDYRKQVVMIIGRLEGPKVLDKLADIAVNDPSSDVRRAATLSIGRSDESDAAAALMKLAKRSEDSSVRLSAVRSLGRMDDEDAVDLLLDIAMHDSHIKVRTEAVTALGRIGSEAAHDALAKLLER